MSDAETLNLNSVRVDLLCFTVGFTHRQQMEQSQHHRNTRENQGVDALPFPVRESVGSNFLLLAVLASIIASATIHFCSHWINTEQLLITKNGAWTSFNLQRPVQNFGTSSDGSIWISLLNAGAVVIQNEHLPVDNNTPFSYEPVNSRITRSAELTSVISSGNLFSLKEKTWQKENLPHDIGYIKKIDAYNQQILLLDENSTLVQIDKSVEPAKSDFIDVPHGTLWKDIMYSSSGEIYAIDTHLYVYTQQEWKQLSELSERAIRLIGQNKNDVLILNEDGISVVDIRSQKRDNFLLYGMLPEAACGPPYVANNQLWVLCGSALYRWSQSKFQAITKIPKPPANVHRVSRVLPTTNNEYLASVQMQLGHFEFLRKIFSHKKLSDFLMLIVVLAPFSLIGKKTSHNNNASWLAVVQGEESIRQLSVEHKGNHLSHESRNCQGFSLANILVTIITHLVVFLLFAATLINYDLLTNTLFHFVAWTGTLGWWLPPIILPIIWWLTILAFIVALTLLLVAPTYYCSWITLGRGNFKTATKRCKWFARFSPSIGSDILIENYLIQQNYREAAQNTLSKISQIKSKRGGDGKKNREPEGIELAAMGKFTGRLLIASGQSSLAENLYKLLLKSSCHKCEICGDMAELYLLQKRDPIVIDGLLDIALRELKNLPYLRFFTSQPAEWNRLIGLKAWNQMNNNEFAEAEILITQALTQRFKNYFPVRVQNLFIASKILRINGKTDSAENYYQEAMELTEKMSLNLSHYASL